MKNRKRENIKEECDRKRGRKRRRERTQFAACEGAMGAAGRPPFAPGPRDTVAEVKARVCVILPLRHPPAGSSAVLLCLKQQKKYNPPDPDPAAVPARQHHLPAVVSAQPLASSTC